MTCGHALNKKRVGDGGENRAVHYLCDKGYEILRRNYRFMRGEIDIIARDRQTIVFVEVKRTRGGDFGDPVEWVDEQKQKRIGIVAQGYLMEQGLEEADCRFDVIGIQEKNGRRIIRHLVDAFWPD